MLKACKWTAFNIDYSIDNLALIKFSMLHINIYVDNK